jgi:hypothetical protein
MAHFAEIDENGAVLRVIVAEQDFIDSGAVGDPSRWKQTSYNAKDGTGLRKNYAGVGYTYDANLDAFIPPKPYASFVLNEEKGKYEAPIEKPKDGKEYVWDEENVSWKEAVALDPLEVNPL